MPLHENSDDFVFDNQMLAQIAYFGFSIGEVSCPAKYFEEASSINFRRSMVYGLGVVRTSLQYRLAKWGVTHPRLFAADGVVCDVSALPPLTGRRSAEYAPRRCARRFIIARAGRVRRVLSRECDAPSRRCDTTSGQSGARDFQLGYVIGYLDAVALAQASETARAIPTAAARTSIAGCDDVNAFFAERRRIRTARCPTPCTQVGAKIRDEWLREWGTGRRPKAVAESEPQSLSG